jgi:sulfur relay (sulfurtransferase) DsrF/TusC family protein
MAFGAFEQPVTLLLLADAVLMLMSGQQDTPALGRNIERLMGALPDYGIERVCVDGQALLERGVQPGALFGNPATLDAAAIRSLISAHDVVISL